MNDELKTAMIRYYDFMTAYQNLLRDKDTDGELRFYELYECCAESFLNAWPPQKSAITVYAKNVNGRQVIHLLNFLNADNLSWRDLNGTMPEPRLVSEVPLKMNVSGKVNKIWVASPDLHAGASQELSFTTEGRHGYLYLALAEVLEHACDGIRISNKGTNRLW